MEAKTRSIIGSLWNSGIGAASAWTVPEILPEGRGWSWKLMLEVTWFSVTLMLVWFLSAKPVEVTVTL